MVYNWNPKRIKKSNWFRTLLRTISFFLICLLLIVAILNIYPYIEAVQILFQGVPLEAFFASVKGKPILAVLGYLPLVSVAGFLLWSVINFFTVAPILFFDDERLLTQTLTDTEGTATFEENETDDGLTGLIKSKLNKLPWKLVLRIQSYCKAAWVADFLINQNTYSIVEGGIWALVKSLITFNFGAWDLSNLVSVVVAMASLEVGIVVYKVLKELLELCNRAYGKAST